MVICHRFDCGGDVLTIEKVKYMHAKVARTFKHKGAVPAVSSAEAAGIDLRAIEDVELPAGGRALVKTGFAWQIPVAHAGMICPRSGLALDKGITVLNSPAIIDPDYRGDVGVILYNTSEKSVSIIAGDRIAQMLIVPLNAMRGVQEVPSTELTETKRGLGGFGSTGK